MYRLCPTRNAVFPTKSKKIKNVIHASFLVKPSRDRPKKREKNFRSGYRFCQPGMEHP